MKKKAFTLIELLVVIAIIAILAAILFPVFASAKAAAKKTASLSNAKQLSLAVLQYAAVNNDGLPPGDSYPGRDLRAHYGLGNQAWRVWTELVYPFVKSGDMYSDPLKPLPRIANPEWEIHWYSGYGYNQTWLSPWLYENSLWRMSGQSQSSFASVANTVMLTSALNPINDTGAWWRAWYGPDGNGNYGPTTVAKVDSPYCGNIPQYCFDNWGITTDGTWFTFANGVYENGAYTGGVSLHANNGAIVAFVDGHVKRLSLGDLAAGTNFRYDPSTNTGTNTGDLVVNDTTKYIWDNL
jgi:prepilin-type N-terminal cleavage/methylation domain-containing protein/prepilin-type processing-associated H-X9-DG protein